jgi:hypothetical protein
MCSDSSTSEARKNTLHEEMEALVMEKRKAYFFFNGQSMKFSNDKIFEAPKTMWIFLYVQL